MLSIQKKLTNSFYTLLSLPATAMGFALSVQISALSWIMSTQYHLEIDQVGYIWLAGPLAGIIGQLGVGKISDSTWFMGSRRRPYIIAGSIMAALMLWFLQNLQFFGGGSLLITALIVALTLDLAINVSFNPTRSLIADVTPPGEKRTKGFTIMQTVSGFFGVLAYFIGAVWGKYNLIYVGIILVLIFSIVPVLFIKEPKYLSTEEPNSNLNPDNLLTTTKANQTELVKIYAAHGFTWLGIQTMFVFTYAYIEQYITNGNKDASGRTIDIAFLILNSVAFLLPNLVFLPISKKIGRIKTHNICIAVMALAYAFIWFFGQSATTLYAGMLIAGIGWGATVSLPFAIVTEKINPNQTGWYMGIFNLSVVIPQILVSAFFGKLLKNFGDMHLVYAIATLSLAVSAALWLTIKRDKPLLA